MADLPVETKNLVVLNIGKKIVDDSEEFHTILNDLNEQRRTGHLCDSFITCQDQVFKAHRNILSAASHYFKMLFLSPIGNQESANLDNFSKETVSFMLDIIYKNPKSVNTVDIQELLNLAAFLQADSVSDLLFCSIRTTLDETNCIQWYHIAKETNTKKLEYISRHYISLNYDILLKKKKAKKYKLNVDEILSGNKIAGSDEKVVVLHSNNTITNQQKFFVFDLAAKTCKRCNKDGPFNIDGGKVVVLHSNNTVTESSKDKDGKYRILGFYIDKDDNLYLAKTNEMITGLPSWVLNLLRYDQCQQKFNFTSLSILDRDDSDDDSDSDDDYRFEDSKNKSMFYQICGSQSSNPFILVKSKKCIYGYQVDVSRNCSELSTLPEAYIPLPVKDNSKVISMDCKMLDCFIVANSHYTIYKIERLTMKTTKLDIKNFLIDDEPQKPLDCMWNLIEVNKKLYFFAVFQTDRSKLFVLKLKKSARKFHWDLVCVLPVSGNVIDVFVFESEIYVLLCDIWYEGYCFCNDRELCENNTHYEGDTDMDKLFHFDSDKKSLEYTGIKTEVPDCGGIITRTTVIPRSLLW